MSLEKSEELKKLEKLIEADLYFEVGAQADDVAEWIFLNHEKINSLIARYLQPTSNPKKERTE